MATDPDLGLGFLWGLCPEVSEHLALASEQLQKTDPSCPRGPLSSLESSTAGPGPAQARGLGNKDGLEAPSLAAMGQSPRLRGGDGGVGGGDYLP